MTFWQRLKLYLIGFGIGLIILAMILNKRGCKGINTLKIEEIFYQRWEINDALRCKLKCLGFDNDSLLRLEAKNCKVDYSKSDVHQKPCGQYVVESTAGTYTLLVNDCDSVSVLKDVVMKQACNCQ